MTARAVKGFVKTLTEIDRSKSTSEKFEDFLTMGFCALSKRTSTKERGAELEAEYMRIVGTYRNKDDVRRMPELLAKTFLGVNAGMDFLGSVAAELGVLEKHIGQFFTPIEVSRLMAELSLGGVESTLEEKGFVTIHEPASGAGGMVLAAAQVVEGRGFDASTSMWVEAVDVGRTAFHMSFIQLACRGLAGRVIWGNSLSLEVFGMAVLPGSRQFIARHGDPFAGGGETEVESVRHLPGAQQLTLL